MTTTWPTYRQKSVATLLDRIERDQSAFWQIALRNNRSWNGPAVWPYAASAAIGRMLVDEQNLNLLLALMSDEELALALNIARADMPSQPVQTLHELLIPQPRSQEESA